MLPKLAGRLKPQVLRALMRRAGELGVLGIEIPEEYGGLGLGKVRTTYAAEIGARDGS